MVTARGTPMYMMSVMIVSFALNTKFKGNTA